MNEMAITSIFSINPGRCGSQYLYKLLASCDNCEAWHEHKPIGNGRAMRDFLNGDRNKMRIIADEKLHKISDVSSDKIYAETNHCFIKGFGWELMPELPRAQTAIIHLHRKPELIIESLMKVGASALMRDGINWIILPNRNSPLVAPPSGYFSAKTSYLFYRLARIITTGGCKRLPTPAFIKQYEYDCLNWYLKETEALAKLFKQTFPDALYIDVDIEDLNIPEKVFALLKQLGLNASSETAALVGQASNTTSQRL